MKTFENMKTFDILTKAVLITRIEAKSKKEALRIFNEWDADKRFDNSIPWEVEYVGEVKYVVE